MPDTNTTTSFTAGNITLSGWVTDFTTNTDQYLLPLGANTFAFEFNGTNTPSFGEDPGPYSEPAQQIGLTGSGNLDDATLTLSFTTGQSGLALFEGGSQAFTANSGDTLTLGGGGTTAAEVLAELRDINIKDTTTPGGGDPFGISFTLTDLTHAGAGPVSWTENFVTVCYAPGTRIATPTGEMAVEDLQIGDLVATTSGVAKPVKWLGRRSHTAAAVAKAPNLRPVVVRAGALGRGLPHRDLVVSPMHALLIDEVFVPAAALVNGTSIVRSEAAGTVEYIHVELDQHDVIFAEGTPAETFVDDNSRALFDNVSEYYDLYGIAESRRGFAVARIEEGYQLEAIRRRLAGVSQTSAPGALAGHVERLEDGVLEGWVMDSTNPATPVELEVLVDGEIVATVLANRYRVDLDCAGYAGGRYGFTAAMPASAESLAQVAVRRASDGGQVAMPKRALVSA